MAENWDDFIDWDSVLPPNRPTLSFCKTVRSYAARIDRHYPVGVLGSTPELRDILSDMHFKNIFVFDRNPKFYNLMTSMRAYSNAETFVQGDWVDTLETFGDRLHLLVSDLTSGNIPYDSRPALYHSITAAIAKGGLFLDRVLTHPAAHLKLDDLDAKYQELPCNLITLNDFNSEYLFCSELLSINEVVDSTLFYDILGKRFTHPTLRRLLRDVSRVTPANSLWYYGRPWSMLEKTYGNGLDRLEMREDDPGPFYGRAKIFAYQKLL